MGCPQLPLLTPREHMLTDGRARLLWGGLKAESLDALQDASGPRYWTVEPLKVSDS